MSVRRRIHSFSFNSVLVRFYEHHISSDFISVLFCCVFSSLWSKIDCTDSIQNRENLWFRRSVSVQIETKQCAVSFAHRWFNVEDCAENEIICTFRLFRLNDQANRSRLTSPSMKLIDQR